MDSEREATFAAAVGLFEKGRYLAAHELFEELWESTQGPDSDFYKALVQASVALHLRAHGNVAGATKLHASLRALLAPYLPHHHGVEVALFLQELQAVLRPEVVPQAQLTPPKLLRAP